MSSLNLFKFEVNNFNNNDSNNDSKNDTNNLNFIKNYDYNLNIIDFNLKKIEDNKKLLGLYLKIKDAFRNFVFFDIKKILLAFIDNLKKINFISNEKDNNNNNKYDNNRSN